MEYTALDIILSEDNDFAKIILGIQPIITFIYLIFVGFITFLANLHSKGICCFKEGNGCNRVDDVKWIEGALFLLQIWDLYSDVLFCISCARKAIERGYELIDMILFIGSLVFVIVPYAANLVQFSLELFPTLFFFFRTVFFALCFSRVESLFYGIRSRQRT